VGENDEASTASIASQSIGAGEGRVEDRARERRFTFLAIMGVVLVALAGATIVLIRRGRRARALLERQEERHEARVKQVLDRRRKRELEHAAQVRAHEQSVRAAAAAEASAKKEAARSVGVSASTTVVSAGATDVVCSVCGRGLPPHSTFCPHDGTPVVPAAQATPRPGAPRGKICPTCGERFDGLADFCGKDGTQLVLLN
jgi:hypothetical protein